MSSKKILIIVEGAKKDDWLMKRLFAVYGIAEEYEVVSYKTNIYTLYRSIFDEYGGSNDIDLNQLLKSKEKDDTKWYIFEQRYTDTILVFDLDPQDPDYSPEKIVRMCDYFNNSSENGKLYLNFPMVEAFWHMKSIPDENYYDYYATLEELKNRKYKQRVHYECRDGDPTKFAKSKEEFDVVILQNIRKANMLIDYYGRDFIVPEINNVLVKELDLMRTEDKVSVLCTCVFYLPDYNPAFLEESYNRFIDSTP